MERVIDKDDRYSGKYVALKSPQDDTIVGAGDTIAEALNEARQKGESEAIIFYIPPKGSTHIY